MTHDRELCLCNSLRRHSYISTYCVRHNKVVYKRGSVRCYKLAKRFILRLKHQINYEIRVRCDSAESQTSLQYRILLQRESTTRNADESQPQAIHSACSLNINRSFVHCYLKFYKDNFTGPVTGIFSAESTKS